jgi:hypothetical protein
MYLRTNDKSGGGQMGYTTGDDNEGVRISGTTNGYVLGSTTSSTSRKLYKNGSTVAQLVSPSANFLPNFDMCIFGSNPFGIFSNNNLALVSFGDGLNDTETANLYTTIQTFQTSLGRSVGPQTVSDSDAQLFVTNANIQDQVQAQAINTLVTDLKAYGLWNKMQAIYPFVGGTASSHKFNLKDPRDLDAAFRLVFNGGWTHSATGVTGNGVNAYANTFYNPFLNSSINQGSFGVYNRTNVTAAAASFGANNATFEGSQIYIKNIDNNLYWANNDYILDGAFVNANPITGFYQTTINPSTTTIKEVYRNNVVLNTQTRLIPALPNVNMAFGARNVNNTIEAYDPREYCFFYIGQNLTATEISNYYTAVQAFQTTLSRQV